MRPGYRDDGGAERLPAQARSRGGPRSRSVEAYPAPRPSSWSSVTTRGGCTTTCGSSGTGRSRAGRCRRACRCGGGASSRRARRGSPARLRLVRGRHPGGRYGAGTVEIWDRGTYELLEEKRDGGLTVHLRGERVDGVWTLVPARLDGDERNWLLLRKDAAGDGGAGAPRAARDRDGGPADGARLALRAQVGRLPRDRDAAGRTGDADQPQRQRPHRALPGGRARSGPCRPDARRLCSTRRCAPSTSRARPGSSRSRRAPGGSSSWSSTCSCSTTSRSTCAR